MKITAAFLPRYRRTAAPYTLAMTQAVLKARGHRVRALDLNDRLFHESYRFRTYWRFPLAGSGARALSTRSDELVPRWAEELLADAPDLIVLTSFGGSADLALELGRAIRRRGGVPVAVAGLRATPEGVRRMRPEWEAFAAESAENHVVVGEDEEELPRLAAAIASGERGGPRTRRPSPVADLDSLPFCDFSGLDLGSYAEPGAIEMFFTRSCSWSCAFCPEWQRETGYRSMSGRRLFAELEHQARALDRLGKVHFFDNTLNGDVGALEEMSRLLAERRGGFPRPLYWRGQAMIRPEMTADLLRTMAKAGCVGLNYGLESGSERVRRAMRKPVDGATAERVVRETAEAGIGCTVNLIVGFPTETRADLQESVAFVERNARHIESVAIAFPSCRVTVDSPMRAHPERFGLRELPDGGWESDAAGGPRERLERCRALAEAVLRQAGTALYLHGREIRGRAALEAALTELEGQAAPDRRLGALNA